MRIWLNKKMCWFGVAHEIYSNSFHERWRITWPSFWYATLFYMFEKFLAPGGSRVLSVFKLVSCKLGVLTRALPSWVWHFSTAIFFFQFFKKLFWKTTFFTFFSFISPILFQKKRWKYVFWKIEFFFLKKKQTLWQFVTAWQCAC